MNSLSEPPISRKLVALHAAARRDRGVFMRALPSVIAGFLQGRQVAISARPYLKDAYIPVDPQQGVFLYQTVRATGARRIVEFGTSFGISTIYLAAGVRDNGGGTVVTTEIEPRKIEDARRNFEQAGVDEQVSILEGDALQTLLSVQGQVDLLFLDGWKEMCLPVLKLMEPQLRPGSVVLCDNVKSFRTTLGPYLAYVRDNPQKYSSMLLPLSDGLEFTIVTGDPPQREVGNAPG
jgi:predicted O-methyltransferase YrrM